ncbi:MAG: hypothetical protein U9O82_09720, partial [Thermodesulfobacteriota bacterium]|nr:hypothetical protein [Thermodesulfobacteriota bacterium]
QKCIIKTVLFDHIPVVYFDIDNPNERKIAVIELVEQKLCSQKMAGKLCGFHRNTVFKLLRTKELLGIFEVLKDDRGHKEPYKYISKIRLHVKKLLRKYPDLMDQDIALQAAKDLDTSISRSSVARIRTEKQAKKVKTPNKKELPDMAKEAESFVKEHIDKRQLWLTFETEPELKQKAEKYEKEPSPKTEGEAQKDLLEQLQRGSQYTFAGGMMHHLFLHEIGFEQIMAPFPLNPGATYQSADIMFTIFHSITQGIESIEALKLINAGDFGLLIGRSRIADKVTIRGHLNQMAQQNQSDKLIDQFARLLLEHDRIDREVFFIDGHFLPYYGLRAITKGYFTVRRQAMKGNELYMVTDLQARPLFFINESNEIDFRPIISRSAVMLKDFGINRPIMVFDRGGYGIHFFKELDQDADFVTWAKYLSAKSLNSISESLFHVGLQCGGKRFLACEEARAVSESAQNAKKDGRDKPDSMELRLVVLLDVATGKRMGIYTNNMSKPLYDTAYYMLQRWGKSENVYKEFMAAFNLDYHPGYDIKELEKQPLVDNPDIKLIKKAIKSLKNEAVATDKEIQFIEMKLERRPDKCLNNKLLKLEKETEEVKADIHKLGQKLLTLPDKISIIELLKGKFLSRCDLEKKKLYDFMQIMAYHSRERLVEIFKECYSDHRDPKKVLDMITTRPGLVKLVGNTLMIILEWIDNNKHREAAERLCHKLNQLGVKLVGGLDVKLSFHIARYP